MREIIKPRLNSPCECCKLRYLGCHAECIDYQQYRHKQDEINELLLNGKRRKYSFDDYKADIIKRKNKFYSHQKCIGLN